MRHHRFLLLASAALALPAAAHADETITYSYDAKGRLVEAERSGTVNTGVKTSSSTTGRTTGPT